jgi:5-methyltetrahydrofolate--homocysteine methyltransferase
MGNGKYEELRSAIVEYNNELAVSAAKAVAEQGPDPLKALGALKEAGIRKKVKVMVGGSAITQEFADSIGADGYDPIAPGAVELAKRLRGSQGAGE